MNLVLLVADPDGGPIPEATRRRYDCAPCVRGLEVTWHDAGSAAAMLARDEIGLEGFGPAVVLWDTYLGAGAVRLDNRAEVAQWAVGRGPTGVLSDLALVVRAIALRGEGVIPDLLGDFAFVIWDTAMRSLVAARDAFGVKRLCYRDGPHLLAFSSRAELLAEGDAYDIQPLVEMIALCDPSPDRTVYAGVRAVPPASVVRGRAGGAGRLAVHEYWSPERFEPAPILAGKEEECYGTFRALFAESVRQRLTGAPNVWSQLSGGLDSSSVVSMAQWLAQRGEVPYGVSGTISWVYRWSTDGDEREYSDAVAKHWGVRNEVMLNDWFWQDDGEPPPLTDEPDVEYVTWARERRTIRIIRAAGGRVLLTGLGSDQYLLGNMLFFADWVAAGRIRDAVTEMLRRAALGRVSFWELAYRNAVLPLLPGRLRHHLLPGSTTPPWIPSALTRQFGITHTQEAESYDGENGRKYAHLVARDVRSLHRNLRRNLFADDYIETRHPFLYRPLVEFALRLPAELCVQPHARKWVLRCAMQGILPEKVRERVGKGANLGGVHQSLRYERQHLEGLLADPLLAQLGCVDTRRLRHAYESACQSGELFALGAVAYSLSIEEWLQVRSGRRIAEGSTARR